MNRALSLLVLATAWACSQSPAGVGARCGNGKLDAGETCDEGSRNSDTEPGACRTDCRPARCGDAVVDEGEGCDDGETNGAPLPGGCREECVPAACGDGVLDAGEACDDGRDNGDWPGACRATCVSPSCGDGVVDPDEGCDDGEANSDTVPDACRTTCAAASCGDGVVDGGEECDDGIYGSDTRPDGCRTTCRAASCGDGALDSGETCDAGPANSDVEPDACRTTCVPPSCGDGTVDSGESCDDGARNGNEPGSCRPTCILPRCGDGVADPGEACDDGNVVSGDGCDRICRVEESSATCGDGAVGGDEDCDDGNVVGGDGCSPSCRAEIPTICGMMTPTTVIDLRTAGVADGSGGVSWSGSNGSSPSTTWSPECGGRTGPEVILAWPVRRPGNLVVQLDPQAGFDPVLSVRATCDDPSSEGACVGPAVGGSPGRRRSVVLAGLEPSDGILWIAVDAPDAPAQQTGTVDLRLFWVPTLGLDAACRSDGSTGACDAATSACADPDGDGAGTCVPVVPTGAPCDPAGARNLCPAHHACIGPDGAAVCVPRCGNGTLDPGEECDDGNWADGDNCSAACKAAGDTCAAPHRLELDATPGVRGWAWRASPTYLGPDYVGPCGYTPGPDAVSSFTAPSTGRWAFSTSGAALYLWDGTCDPFAVDLACALPRGETLVALAVDLAAGQTVYAVADRATYYDTAALETRVVPVVCGDGFGDPGEACDDGNTGSGDNCSMTCDAGAGRSCDAPWVLSWDESRARGAGARWASTLAGFPSVAAGSCSITSYPYPEAVASFVAPSAGSYTFRVSGLNRGSFYLRESCGAPAPELGCTRMPAGGPAFLTATLAAGATAFVYVDSDNAQVTPFEVTVDRVVCGDGVLVAPEDCDDGNRTSGDGCTDTCLLETLEVEPNDTPATATPIQLGTVVRGKVESINADVYSFPCTPGRYRIEVYAGAMGYCYPALSQPTATVRFIEPSGTTRTASGTLPPHCPVWEVDSRESGTCAVSLQRTGGSNLSPSFLRVTRP